MYLYTRHVKLKLPCGPQKQQKLLKGPQSSKIVICRPYFAKKKIVVKNDFTVFFVPKYGLLITNLS